MPTYYSNTLSRAAVASLLALAIVATPGCNPSDPATLLKEAQSYHAKGDNRAALIQLKNAVQKAPNNADVRVLLGTVFTDLGDAKSAEIEFDKALDLGVPKSRLVEPLARTQLMQGQYDKAIVTMGNASGPAFSAMRGDAQLGLGHVSEARDFYREALKQQPDNIPAALGIARIAAMQQDFPLAGRTIDGVLAKHPKDVQALMMKADFERLQGRVDGAIAAYGAALKAKPDYFAALVGRASAYILKKNFPAAKTDIDAARKLAPNNPVVNYTEALWDIGQKRYAAAQDALMQVLRVVPGHTPSLLLLGTVQQALGSPEQAEKNLNRALNDRPDDLATRKLIASNYLSAKRPQDALETLSPALEKNPNDTQLLSLAGEAYMQTKQFDQASRTFAQVAKLAPNDPNARTRLGVSQLAAGNEEAAITDLNAASKEDASSFKADAVLVLNYLSKKQYDKAMQAAQALKKKQPNNPVTYNLLGAVYLGMKDTASARQNFEHAVALQPDYGPGLTNLAQLDLRENKPDAAKKRFSDLLAKDPKNIFALVSLARLQAATGQTKESIALLERAHAADPNAAEPTVLLTRLYLDTDKQKALRLANEAAERQPANAPLLDNLGLAQAANGDYNSALATYDKLISLQPKAPVAYYRRASVQAALGDTNAARVSLNQALKLAPNLADAKIALAVLELRAGRAEEALKVARGIQTSEPKSPLGFALEGDILMQQKRFADAAAAFQRAFAIVPSSALAVKSAGALRAGNRSDEAIALLTRWLKQQPKDAAATAQLAEAYLSQGKTAEAMRQYEAAVQLAPNNVLVLNNLAWLYQQNKDPRALTIAKRAYDLQPGNPAVLDTMGWALVEQNKAAEAKPYLEKAVAQAPKSGAIRYHYGVMLAKTGDTNGARKAVQQALQDEPNFSEAPQAKSFLQSLGGG